MNMLYKYINIQLYSNNQYSEVKIKKYIFKNYNLYMVQTKHTNHTIRMKHLIANIYNNK